MTERGHKTNLREQTTTEHRERSQMRITQYYKLNKDTHYDLDMKLDTDQRQTNTEPKTDYSQIQNKGDTRVKLTLIQN